MTVLVAYATRHGATKGIAERIASRLCEAGIETVALPASSVRDPAGYDAFVVGGAAYLFHWLKDATAFVRHNQALLASRPTWLFSSGPVGTDLVDADGRDVLETTVPREFAELREAVHPRGERIFFGAVDPVARPIGISERLMAVLPAARNAIPKGDFRDWPAIDAWADEIAAALAPVAAAGG
jgi:menaquinone-dependent protoporphyrinogen oxidase